MGDIIMIVTNVGIDIGGYTPKPGVLLSSLFSVCVAGQYTFPISQTPLKSE